MYKIVNTDEKESLTTLFMVNAAGCMVFIHDNVYVPYNVSSTFLKGWHIIRERMNDCVL